MKQRRLEKFLFNRVLLEAFKYNLSKPNSNYPNIEMLVNCEFQNELILGAFGWKYSPEGVVFWENVHSEWKVSLEENTF